MINKTKAQDLINQIGLEEEAKKEFKQWILKTFYPNIWNQEQADLNLSLVVGK
jgi:hypothetical protein